MINVTRGKCVRETLLVVLVSATTQNVVSHEELVMIHDFTILKLQRAGY